MKKVKGIKRYAKQLLAAVELNEVPAVMEQLGSVALLMDSDRGFNNLLVSPAFSEEERGKILGYVAGKLNMSDRTAAFLRHLSSAGVIVALPEILKAVNALYLDLKKRASAVVTTPVEISEANRDKLSTALKLLTGKDIDIEFVLDKTLLGGVGIKVGSTMYDSSIKGQLGLLRDKLIKG